MALQSFIELLRALEAYLVVRLPSSSSPTLPLNLSTKFSADPKEITPSVGLPDLSGFRGFVLSLKSIAVCTLGMVNLDKIGAKSGEILLWEGA